MISKTENERLGSCSEEIQVLFIELDGLGIEFQVIEGHRGKLKQDEYYDAGKSKLPWPKGEHNKIPSDACDVAPIVNGRLSWDKHHCIFFAGQVLMLARLRGIKIRWGGDWDMDGECITDQQFQDLVHFEVRR